MNSSTIYGSIASYKVSEVDGEVRVALKVDTSWSMPLSMVLEGERVDECMEAWGIETIHAMKGLSFAIEVDTEFDDETGRPIAFNPTGMQVIGDDNLLCLLERVKSERKMVPYTVPDEVRYCAN